MPADRVHTDGARANHARTHAAYSDCECVRTGFIGQPANTATSLAYVVAAGGLLRQGRRVPAGLLAAAGLGSIGYHGPGSPRGKWLHDISLVCVMAGTVAFRPTGVRASISASILGIAVVVHAQSRTDARWCRPQSLWQGHALWHLLSAAALYEWFATGPETES